MSVRKYNQSDFSSIASVSLIQKGGLLHYFQYIRSIGPALQQTRCYLFTIKYTQNIHYFTYIFLTSGVKLHIHLLNVVVQFVVFLTLSALICRGTDISKCFRESLEFEITRVDCTLKYIDFQSGIPSECLLLSLEPEAASLFCKYLPVERMKGGANRNITCFQPNAKYLVLDAGGMRAC